MIRRMLKEEWRMHSELYRGRSFATFPLVVFLFSLSASWIVFNFSELGPGALSAALEGFGAFIGLAVGSIGFSSRDAMKNVLGPMNLLVYSSRTLPISRRKLLIDFLAKDVIYYSFLFLLPIALGPLLVAGPSVFSGASMMFVWFFVGLGFSLLLARSSLHLPDLGILRYRGLSRLGSLAAKSVLDVARSSGGFLKLVFSVSILTGFYWFSVLYFPVTAEFLSNPLLSFSVVAGILNLSIYNWLNRFDAPEDYSYLPVVEDTVLDAKKKAYLVLALPFSVLLVSLSYFFYPYNYLMSILTAVTVTLYTLVIASRLTGLHPNERLFDSTVLLKFTVLNSLVVVPLLLLSIVYNFSLILSYAAFCIPVIAVSASLLRRNPG